MLPDPTPLPYTMATRYQGVETELQTKVGVEGVLLGKSMLL